MSARSCPVVESLKATTVPVMELRHVVTSLLPMMLLLLSPLRAAPPLDQPLGPGVSLPMRDANAAKITTQAVSSPEFWSTASVSSYDDEQYDQLRLRPLDAGYFTLITGEGGADYSHEVVVNTAYRYQDRLPAIEDSALAVTILGEGIDPISSLPYVDTLFFLDFALFYGIYIQRSYRLDVDERTFVFFETLRPDYVDAATWTRYQATLTAARDGASLRWVFNRVIEIEEVYGTFIVEPGIDHTSRVSFLVRLHFGEQAGLVARLGSEMPAVLKVGLQSGFKNCVRIAGDAQRAK